MKTIFRSRLHLLLLAFAIANPAIPVAYAQAATAANPITIVAEGKSAYTVVIPVGAPVSVQNAAQEMQRCIAIATGVSLSLVQDDAMVTGPVISIGATVQADAAGITTQATQIGALTTQEIESRSKAEAAFYALLSADQQAKFKQLHEGGPMGGGVGGHFRP